MRVSLLSVALLIARAQGFAPSLPAFRPTHTSSFHVKGAQPLNSLPEQWSDALSSLTLADVLEGVSDSLPDSLPSMSDTVSDVVDAMDAVPADDNGWFGFLTVPIEGLLELIHSAVGAGTSVNSWGISIIILTCLIKVVTFPLTKSQLESTGKMQAMQPAIKEIQAKYQSNPEVMNQKVAEFYQVNEINPLAGCIPSLVQIPVFIGLYRAVLNLAKDNKLDEPFFFLPNLEGPTYGADPAHGTDWLFQGWTDAGPALGWDDTISFLILPVLLVVSQFASMELMQPKDPSQQQNNIVLKLLPILIGWFALNVPAALSVYWFVNNIVTTATSVVIRNGLDFEPVPAAGAAAATVVEPPPTIFAPPREKPAGFGGPVTERSVPKDTVKPITAIDAEVVEVTAPQVVEEVEEEEEEVVVEETVRPKSKPRKKKGKRGRKRKKN